MEGEGAPRAQPSGVPFDTGGKILKPPEVFNPATLEEEVSQWSDWSFAFKNFLAFMDYEFLADLKKAERMHWTSRMTSMNFMQRMKDER